MTKKAGITTWKRKRKKEYLELKQERYYIFCEGEQTEPNYFKGFKESIEDNPIYKDMILIEIEPCGAETLRVIEYAEKYVKKNHINKGQIWCVYDKDSFPARDFNAVIDRMNSLNNKNKDVQFYAAWSNECIEYWFILNFDYYRSNNDRRYYITYLNNKFKKLGIGKYKKNMKDIFNILSNHGNPKMAIKYAKKIINENKNRYPNDIAPGTTVYQLVEELSKYLPEDIKEKFI